MALIFDTIITQGVRAGQIPARTQAARNWYRQTAKKITTISEKNLMRSEPERLRTGYPIPGAMYMFFYDPKHKDTLPYYDRFPLIFPYARAPGGFMGLNLHYLPRPMRARLMDALYDFANNKRFDESTKIRMSYQLLQSTAKLKYFKPCVKHYLTAHVQSKFLYIYPSEWDIALFLPTEKFTKSQSGTVWQDSMRMIRG